MRAARISVALLLLSAGAQAQWYVISTYAGGGPPPTPARGVDVPIGDPQSVATDAAGNSYFVGFGGIYKLDRNGIMTRVAGNSHSEYSGDGGPATSAGLSAAGLAMDRAGNLLIADSANNRIRRVSPDGLIATVAGSGAPGFSGDGGPATSAALSGPSGVTVDKDGNILVADSKNGRVRKISPNGIITTVAGGGTATGDGVPAINATLSGPTGVAVDGSGNLYILDSGRVRRVSADGMITTTDLTGRGIAADSAGNLYAADFFDCRIPYYPSCPNLDQVRKMSTSGIITTVAGDGRPGFNGDGGPATAAQLYQPSGVAVDGSGNLFIADTLNGRIREVSPGGIITTVAGNGNTGSYSYGDGGPAIDAGLSEPAGLASDAEGNLFIADYGNHRVRKVSPSGNITTVAGGGFDTGDGGSATAASLTPWDVAVDSTGNLFITDSNRIRKVSPSGTITTVAAQLFQPTGAAVDHEGNFFVAISNYILKVSPAGIVSTVAGKSSAGYSGDGGPAFDASLSYPSDVAVDPAGNLFIADTYNHRVREISTSGMITTVAGSGVAAFSGDGSLATNAAVSYPTAVAVDRAGSLFIASGGRIRKVSLDGIITTIAGNGGTYGRTLGDGVLATSISLSDSVRGLAVDAEGNVYVSDPLVDSVVHMLRPVDQPVWLTAVLDAASEQADTVSPGKMVAVYGIGLGPAQIVQSQPIDGQIGTALAGTAVFFNGIAAPVLYTSNGQIGAIAPYALTGPTADVTVAYQGQSSKAVTVRVAASAPSLFTLNQTGAGQAVAIHASDGTINTAANPARIGEYISLYATGEGQTTPAGADGRIATGAVLPQPNLHVSATVGGVPAVVQYAGAAPGQVAGLMQVNVQIPSGVQPGGYVPVVLRVGDRSSSPTVWIAVSGN